MEDFLADFFTILEALRLQAITFLLSDPKESKNSKKSSDSIDTKKVRAVVAIQKTARAAKAQAKISSM